MTARDVGVSTESTRQEVFAGRYRVERELGRGGMATVFLCVDTQTDELVALKLLRPELGSAVVVERFLREIAFASELEHPQIPKVLDSGVIDTVPFYVMTYVEGESLRAKLDREKQLPIDEVIRITGEVIKPLGFAHSRGIVHRDIKPANILLSGNSVFVLDLGVARAIVESSTEDSLTSTGVAVGTPAYMSPEQALADHNLDARSDIYSLGCVVYEMVAGIPPFVGATPQSVMARRFASPPPPLDEIREFVPPSLQHAIAKAMARSPADRWKSLEEFGSSLSGAAFMPSMAAQAVVLEKKKRRYASAVIGAVLVAAAGVGGAIYANGTSNHVAKGRTALSQWDFRTAEREFRASLQRDSTDAASQLWLAQLLMLKGGSDEEWKSLALRAFDRKSDLDAYDQRRAQALAASTADGSADKCAELEKLATTSDAARAADFTATLSYADCMLADRAVVPDKSSPSGYRFRRSYARIASIYEGLATRHARNTMAFGALMPRLERVLTTNKTTLRGGIATGDAQRQFYAYPSLKGDSLTYIPVQIGSGGVSAPDPRSLERIIARNLERLENLSRLWARNAPADPDAHETLARTLEASGRIDVSGVSALSEIALARKTASPPTNGESFVRALRLASSGVRLLVKSERFDAAASLADSILAWKIPADLDDAAADQARDDLSGLAALTGQLWKVVSLGQEKSSDYEVQLANGEIEKLPSEVARDKVALESYAYLGAPAESVLTVRARIERKLSSLLPQAKVSQVENSFLVRPLMMAAPAVGPGPAASLTLNDNGVKAMRAVSEGNRALARRIIGQMASLHSASAPGEVTVDVVFLESWLRATTGETAAAATFLDNSLGGLTRASPNFVSRPMLAGSLVRAMILRAQLAGNSGDAATAAKWKAAATSLWRRADPPLLELLNSKFH